VQDPMFDGVEIATGAVPVASIIWLHGLGADGHDFEPLVPELQRPYWPALRFVFPHAPIRPVTLNAGFRMRAWYDILGTELLQLQDEKGISASIEYVHQLVAREAFRGVPAERIVLAGFSQGGAIALAAGLTCRHRLAGIMALSTYVPIAHRLDSSIAAVQQGLPIFVGHGTFDPVVPHPLGLTAVGLLERWGFGVTWRSYAMAHALCDDEIQDIADWFEHVLPLESA
jgi:phospholipase/carboxylesterase